MSASASSRTLSTKSSALAASRRFLKASLSNFFRLPSLRSFGSNFRSATALDRVRLAGAVVDLVGLARRAIGALAEHQAPFDLVLDVGCDHHEVCDVGTVVAEAAPV